MNVLLIGISGAGKDTQADMLVEKYGFINISTGQILRDRAKIDDDYGRFIAAEMQKGFPADDVVYGLLAQRVVDDNLANENNIFNAVVRRESQIELLDNLLKVHDTQLDMVIYLDLETEEAVRRLLRRADEQAREDDNPETIRLRIEAFKADKQQILEIYKQRGILSVINAEGTVEEVHQKIVKSLNLT